MGSNIEAADVLACRVSPKTIWVFVRLRDREGHIGWGEATLSGQEASLQAAATALTAKLLGRHAPPSSNLLAEMRVARSDQSASAIASAIDLAMWDIEGKRTGRPLHALLGPQLRSSVGIYANINRRTTDRSPAGFAASARKAIGEGYDAIKIAPFDGVIPGSTAGVEQGIARAAAVRDAIGPARKLMVDCHWRFDEATASVALDELAKLGLYWFECPIAENAANFEALLRLRRRTNDAGALLTGCEMETGIDGFRPYIELAIYDAIMPDVKYAGGLPEFTRIAELAARHGVSVAPHNPSGPICHVASLHLGAMLPGFLVLEHQYDESPLFEALVSGEMPKTINAASTPPASPGLGIALDDTRLVSLDTILAAR